MSRAKAIPLGRFTRLLMLFIFGMGKGGGFASVFGRDSLLQIVHSNW